MTEQKKITNWSYPFKPRIAPGAEPTEDVWLYQQALANALGGHYPLGTNGLWHGGVHFDQGTAGLLDQSSVYCIADGEVIAYRIDERYPVSEYESGPKPYSTGFVLVRHRLEVPKPTPVDATQTAAEAASPSPSLTLFSLYMHLLDWEHYGLEGAPNPPAFISETLYTVKPDKATDSTLGLRVRATPGNGTVLALLPKGTRVEVGDTHPGSVKWRRLINVIEGSALPSLAACDSGWVFTGEMESTPAPNVFLVGEHANDHEPNLAPQRGLNVRKTGRGNASDAKTGLLPEGTHVSLEPGTTPYRKIKAIIEGTALPPLAANSVQNIQGYVHFDSLQATRTTPVCGAVHLLDPPYPIKAGELIGHPGHYQNHNDGAPQTLLHLEVFSCDDVPAFIAQSRALAAALPAEQKTQLKIHKGASKLIPHREGIDANHPPSITDAGTTIGVDLIIPLSTLERLPPSHKITVNTATSPGPVTHWWRLDNLLADNDGNPISGWLAEQDLITTRHSPWEWEGFECVEDDAGPIDKLAYTFNANNIFCEDEEQNYRAQISKADTGSMLTIARLYDIVDTDKDGALTHEEIRSSLNKSWHAQALGQLITQYESEWFWNQNKWDELDPLLTTPQDSTNQDWRIEKQRIEKLGWWKQLPGHHKIKANGEAWHLQAPILIANFGKNKNYCFICKKNISISYDLMREICPTNTAEDFIKDFVLHADNLFKKYGVNSCAQVTHLLAQAKHETKNFTAFRESLYYSRYTAQELYNMAPTAINNGFARKGITFLTNEEKLEYIRSNLLKNDAGYGQHCFGSNEYPNNDYRGRGLLHLTHYENYHACSLAIGKPIDAEPNLVQGDISVIIETGLWFWKTNNLKNYAESSDIAEEETVEKITRAINGGTNGLAERKKFKKDITTLFIRLYGNCTT